METFIGYLRGAGVIFQVILIFNLMIVVHELGHFLAARWRGLQVDKFQIWFGKPIWKKKINGVQWGLGTIPFGGFVALPQMAPMETLEGSREDGAPPLEKITPLDKIIVAIAGPLFSLGLAFFFAVIVWKVGYPQNTVEDTTIGYVRAGSPGEEAGLQAGDKIISVDGVEVDTFSGMVDSVLMRTVMSSGEKINFEIERPGEGAPLMIASGYTKAETKGWWKRPAVREVGIADAHDVYIFSAMPGSPGEKAGLQRWDRIVRMNGKELFHQQEVMDVVKANPDAEIILEIQRPVEGWDPETEEFDASTATVMTIPVTPAKPIQPDDMSPMLGIGFGFMQAGGQRLAYPGPVDQVLESLKMMKQTIGAVFSTKTDVGIGHLNSAVGIGRLYYNLLQMENGWRMVFWFSVILNVNLAVLNMLPFPVLDGGHITIALYEWIRRKPINIRFLEIVQTGCALLLFSFMIYVTTKDVGDFFPGGGGDKGARKEILFEMPAEKLAE